MTDDQYRRLAGQLAEDLPVAVEKLTAAQQELAADREERREFETLVRLALKVGASLTAAVLLLLALNGLGTKNLIDGRAQSRANIARTVDNTEEIKKLAERIEDCTTAGGECYDAGVARTGAAVQQINDAALRNLEVVALCRYHPTRQEFLSCLSAAGLDVDGIPDTPAP